MQSLTKRLSSSQDIADAIMQRQAIANENNNVDVQMKSDEQNDEIVNFQKETIFIDSVSLVQYYTIRS
jgi:nicotinate-nucleotide pyrophosphorylase